MLPTPAVALLGLDLGAVISASHNPPEYNGVKLFDRDGRKLTDEAEEEIEALLDRPAPGGGEIDHVEVASESYLEHVLERFAPTSPAFASRRLRERRLRRPSAAGVRAARS